MIMRNLNVFTLGIILDCRVMKIVLQLLFLRHMTVFPVYFKKQLEGTWVEGWESSCRNFHNIHKIKMKQRQHLLIISCNFLFLCFFIGCNFTSEWWRIFFLNKYLNKEKNKAQQYNLKKLHSTSLHCISSHATPFIHTHYFHSPILWRHMPVSDNSFPHHALLTAVPYSMSSLWSIINVGRKILFLKPFFISMDTVKHHSI